MIVVGYEQTTDDGTEYIVDSKHDTKEASEAAMRTLRQNQADNDNLLLYFYGMSLSDTDYKITLIIDGDEELLPDSPPTGD